MATQIITVLCEGPHDVAFITKILKTKGFKSNESTTLGKYPPPMNAILQNEVIKTNVEDLNLTQVRRSLLPSNALKKEDSLIFLYSLGGDGQKTSRQKILNELRQLIPEPDEILSGRLPIDTTLSLLYFFDADDKGIEQRVNEINREIREVLTEIQGNLFETHAQIKTISQIRLGCFIFTEANNNTGKLEHILLPLMKQGNEAIFDNAESYLTHNFDDDRLFPLKLQLQDGTVVENRSRRPKDKETYDQYKSIIGTVGQLQRSGKSNVVCISDSDFLTLDKILTTPKCQEIIAFFEAFITT
jgi:hypothetical protein